MMINENITTKCNETYDYIHKNNTKKRHIKNNSDEISIFNNISINELQFNIGKKTKTKKKKNSNIITNFSSFDWKMSNENENIKFK